MCTAISFTADNHYFGRNLDLDVTFGEDVILTPSMSEVPYRYMQTSVPHFAVIGMGIIQNGFPLYFDGMNEHGLCAAALNFPEFASYGKHAVGKRCVTSFEVIPWILSSFRSLDEAIDNLKFVTVTDDSFSQGYPVTPLHWMVSDKTGNAVIEVTNGITHVFRVNPGVISNSPDYQEQIKNLSRYSSLFDSHIPVAGGEKNSFHDIPGGMSSQDRFVRGTYLLSHSVTPENTEEGIAKTFGILASLAVPRGCVLGTEGKHHFTRYSSCCVATQGIYCFKRYNSERLLSFSFTEAVTGGRTITVIKGENR